MKEYQIQFQCSFKQFSLMALQIFIDFKAIVLALCLRDKTNRKWFVPDILGITMK